MASDDLKLKIKISADDQTKQGAKSAKSGLDSLKKTVTGLIASFTALAAISFATNLIKEFATLDTAIRKAAAVTGDFANAFPEFEEAAKRMGETTQFTSIQAAEALQKLAQSGLDVEQSIGALPSVLNLAAASGAELGVSADILTNIMSQYGFEVEDLTLVSDKLVKTFTSTNTSLEELGFAYTQVGSIAKSAGQDFNDVSAILGELANNGFKGEKGGTALRGGLARLLRPARMIREELTKLQLDVFDDTGAMRPFVDIIQELADKSANTTQLVKIFGVEAGPAMSALVGKGTEGIRALSTEINNTGGTTQQVADDMASGLGGTLSLLESAFDAVKKSMGEALSGGAIDSSKTFIEVLGRIKNPLTTLSKKAGDAFAVVIKAIDSFKGFDIAVAAIVALTKTVAAFAIIAGVKAVSSLAAYVLATRTAARASAELAATNLAELQTEAALISVRIKATQVLLANTQHMAIKGKLAGELSALNLQLAATEKAVASAQASQTAATQAQTLSLKSLLSVTKLLNIAFAAFVGWEIGSFLRENSVAAEKFGIVIAEAAAKLALIVSAPFSDSNFLDDLKEMDQQFQDMYDSVGNESIKAKDKRVENAKVAKESEIKAAEDLKREVASNFEELSDELASNIEIRKEQYLRDLNNMKLAENERLGVLESFGKSQFDIRLANNQQALQLAIEFNQRNLDETEKLFNDEIAHLKKLKIDTADIERQKAAAKKVILKEYESTFGQSIDKLISLEKKHRDKAIAFQKEIQGIETTRNERLRQLDNIGLSEAQQTENKKRQLAQDTAQVKALIAQGEFDKAAELGKKAQELAFEIAKSEKQAAAEGEISSGKAIAARKKYNETVDLTQAALAKAGSAELNKANIATKSVESQKKGLEEVQKKIEALNSKLVDVETVELKVDDKAVDSAIEKIDSIPSEKTVKINVEQGFSAGGQPIIPKFATGGDSSGIVKGKGTSTSDSILSWFSRDEYLLNAKAVKGLGVDFLNWANFSAFPAFSSGGNLDKTPLPSFASGGSFIDNLPILTSQSLNRVATSPISNAQGGQNITESIAIDLSKNGAQSVGLFPRNDATRDLIKQMQRDERLGR